ncbi:hypothetical protein IQ62_05635 [Streptomyces scabiei]|nr:hypothetical protein IQ62_05635 [Streptomyces scabiei]
MPVEGAYVDDREPAVGQVHGEPVADGREAAEAVHDQTGDGVVVLLLGQFDTRGVGDLVEAAPGVHQPASPVGDGEFGDGVGLVGDVAHQFLGDVLVRDDAGDAAVFVQDHGELVVLLLLLLLLLHPRHRGGQRHGVPAGAAGGGRGRPRWRR